MCVLSRVWLFATPWTVAHQAPLSLGFSRQEYWSGLPFPSPGDLPNSGTEPGSPTLQVDALLFEHHWLEGSCFTILCACLLCTRLSHEDAHSPSLLSPPARRPHAIPRSTRAPRWAPCVHGSSPRLRLTPGSVYPSILLSLNLSRPRLALLWPQIPTFCLCVYSCPGNRFIGTIHFIFQETKWSLSARSEN